MFGELHRHFAVAAQVVVVVAVAHGVDLVALADVGRSVFAVVTVVLLHALDGPVLVRVVGHDEKVAFKAFVQVVGENLELDRRGARAFGLADGLDEVGAVLDVPGTLGGDVQFVGAVLHLEDHGVAVVGLGNVGCGSGGGAGVVGASGGENHGS